MDALFHSEGELSEDGSGKGGHRRFCGKAQDHCGRDMGGSKSTDLSGACLLRIMETEMFHKKNKIKGEKR